MAKTARKSADPFVRIVKRDHMGIVPSILVRIFAIVLALIVDAILIYVITLFKKDLAAPINPLEVYKVMFEGTFGSNPANMWTGGNTRLIYTIRDTVTLLIVGIALAPAFKMRFWNIGGEGQILMGALVSGLCMVYIGDKVPAGVLYIAMALTAIVIGAVWAFIPAFFKAHWNTNETLFTLMMNYVATSIMACTTNILRGQASSLGKLNISSKAGWFPRILTDYFGINVTRDNHILTSLVNQTFFINVVIVMLLMVLVFIYLKYSKHGYEITVVGESENTARYAGINVKWTMMRTLIISGALCGLAGFLIVGGKDQTISTNTAGGRGFDAIIVAWLAKFNTFTMLLISFMLVFLENGAGQIATVFKLNEFFSDMISGVILFFILGCEFFVNYKMVFRKKEVRRNV